jgi:hypothetical protein
MTDQATPAKVRLTDGLGPLPEPAAEAVMDLCADHQGPVEACQYLPAYSMLYTADQMRDYAAAEMARAVAAERERCAKVAEGAQHLPNAGDEFANGWCSAALQIAQAIRA